MLASESMPRARHAAPAGEEDRDMADLRLQFSAAILVFATLGCSPRFDARGAPSDAGKTVAEWLAMSMAGTISERPTAVSALAEIAKEDRKAEQRIMPAVVRPLDDKAANIAKPRERTGICVFGGPEVVCPSVGSPSCAGSPTSGEICRDLFEGVLTTPKCRV